MLVRTLLATTLALTAGSGQALAAPCGSIGFAPGTDEVAGDIRARGASCATARSVARRSRGHGPSGTPGTVFRYRTRHFRCRGVERDTALPSVRYRCVRGDAVVRFVKT